MNIILTRRRVLIAAIALSAAVVVALGSWAAWDRHRRYCNYREELAFLAAQERWHRDAADRLAAGERAYCDPTLRLVRRVWWVQTDERFPFFWIRRTVTYMGGPPYIAPSPRRPGDADLNWTPERCLRTAAATARMRAFREMRPW
jgi:hypothetical protein